MCRLEVCDLSTRLTLNSFYVGAIRIYLCLNEQSVCSKAGNWLDFNQFLPQLEIVFLCHMATKNVYHFESRSFWSQTTLEHLESIIRPSLALSKGVFDVVQTLNFVILLLIVDQIRRCTISFHSF